MTTDETLSFMDDISVDVNFICWICKEKFKDPYTTSCDHTFCRACLTQSTLTNCPTCQQSISTDDLKQATLIVRNMIERRRVICSNCSQSGIPEENIDEHIQRTCPKTIISCPAANVKCPWKGPRDQLDDHLIMCPFNGIHSTFIQLKSEYQRLTEQLRRFENHCEVQYQTRIQDIQNIRDNQNINVAEFNEQLLVEESKIQGSLFELMHNKDQISQLEQQIVMLQSGLHHCQSERERIHKVAIQHENQIKELIKKQNIMAGLIGYYNPELIDHIAQCEQRLMKLNEKKLTDRDLFIVVQHAMINKPCEVLDLQSNEITSQGITILADALRANTTLKTLLLDNNRLSDLGVSFLANALSTNNATLKTLDLERNGIMDEGASNLAQMLQKNSALTNLYLSGNQISDQGVQLLTNAMADHNTSLKELILDNNPFVTDASVQPLIHMLKRNLSLQTLRLWNCKLSDKAKEDLSEAASSKTNFTLLC
ncbi:unnamed protein product [Rotaria sp. Silwood2]|nr:unnamed protein product [Rotaria sp. Silwood2]CAF4378075.1 unnamed protein product [Rotaria sp. Silwood2]